MIVKPTPQLLVPPNLVQIRQTMLNFAVIPDLAFSVKVFAIFVQRFVKNRTVDYRSHPA